jgi:hypothetical protein
MKIKVKLVFNDWLDVKNNKSIYQTEEGIQLSKGDLHGGSTFDAEIDLPEDELRTILEANAIQVAPVFYVSLHTCTKFEKEKK